MCIFVAACTINKPALGGGCFCLAKRPFVYKKDVLCAVKLRFPFMPRLHLSLELPELPLSDDVLPSATPVCLYPPRPASLFGVDGT